MEEFVGRVMDRFWKVRVDEASMKRFDRRVTTVSQM